MPYVRIQLKEGRSPELKSEVAQEIIRIMAEKGMGHQNAIRVIYEDMADEDFHKYEGPEVNS